MSERPRPESDDLISRKAYLGHLYAGSRFNRWFGLLAGVVTPVSGVGREQTEPEGAPDATNQSRLRV